MDQSAHLVFAFHLDGNNISAPACCNDIFLQILGIAAACNEFLQGILDFGIGCANFAANVAERG